MKVKPRIKYVNGRAGDIFKSVADKASWFKPKYALADGIKKVIEYENSSSNTSI